MIKRGDIYFADLGDFVGSSKQRGIRPVLIVSNDKANQNSPLVTVVPLTGQVGKKPLPTHVLIPTNCGGGLKRPSLALAEQVATIDKTQLLDYRGHIYNRRVMTEVTRALGIQVGFI